LIPDFHQFCWSLLVSPFPPLGGAIGQCLSEYVFLYRRQRLLQLHFILTGRPAYATGHVAAAELD